MGNARELSGESNATYESEQSRRRRFPAFDAGLVVIFNDMQIPTPYIIPALVLWLGSDEGYLWGSR